MQLLQRSLYSTKHAISNESHLSLLHLFILILQQGNGLYPLMIVTIPIDVIRIDEIKILHDNSIPSMRVFFKPYMDPDSSHYVCQSHYGVFCVIWKFKVDLVNANLRAQK